MAAVRHLEFSKFKVFLSRDFYRHVLLLPHAFLLHWTTAAELWPKMILKWLPSAPSV